MSREAELYKDKIEVSLDGRQIFYLFFGGAVIVGLVFVLGVMVGRRVEARGHTDRARVAATVDPLAALDRLEGGNGLSFQGALRGADGPVSDVEKTIAAMPQKGSRPQASGFSQKDDPKSKKDEPKVDVKKDEPKAEAKKDEPKAEVKKDEPKKAEAKKDEPKAEMKKDEAKKVDVKKDEAKVEAKKDEAKKDEAKKDEAKKDEPAKAKFTLQLSSFQDKTEAQAYLDSMKNAGYSAYITEGAVDGKQYFRVRMGSYKSMEAANDAKAELEKSTKKNAIVMKL
ncbi:MAG TPA: SPOR domain-containing protein [Kofleriaceae bacterium]|nr:SPOR domain-containing protein [Kofleriaceae bacterium]